MANILHRIKAYLYTNYLTENPNDYVARVSSERTLDTADICKAAVSRGGADTTAQAMEHNVNLFFKEMGYQMCDGYSVNTGYFTAGTVIKGVFDSPKEKFDPKKHTINFQFNQAATLIKELPSIEVEILGVAEVGSYIAQVTDVKSGTVNETLTPGRNLKISGDKIKIAGDAADNGVYFINQAGGASTKVDASDIVVNNPSELIIIIPTLTAGSYRLEVKTQFSAGCILKEPRTASLDKLLTVV
jgi:hypothetical protein